ncbi:ABC transporter permease [Nocardioides pantholopis]|uniref:ABC transporter permease n=1 Tax=Nocardioides pantholopis TaxID=2483798 RepID=UPI000F077C92|nr:ABC transporter permease [Nocardioides pantholopis]
MSAPTTQRPQVEIDRSRVRGAGGVLVVARRELSTRFLTKAFALSTLLFALLTILVPLGLGGDDDPEPTRLAHTAATADVARTVAAASDGGVELSAVDDVDRGARLLDDDDVDAVLTQRSDGGYDVLVEETLSPYLATILRSTVHDRALRQAALDRGATPAELESAAASGAVSVVAREGSGSGGSESGGDIAEVLLGLAFGGVAAVVVLLWGIPLATDVMQEKVSRVVEILLTSVRPWQLLAGKVLATTVIGLTQLVVVLAAAYAAMAWSGASLGLDGVSGAQVAVGLVCVVLSVITCCTLMAGLAARVERQEDLASVLQPAMAATLVPLAAAVYLAFEFADTAWLDIASMTPVLNTFVLPARMALESVPAWQVAVSLAVGVLTTAAAFEVAGRVYAGAVLRSGGRVALRDALSAR